MTDPLPVLVAGGTLAAMDGRAVAPGDLLVRGGRIVAVGRVRAPAARVLDASRAVVLPGFVQAHVHLCQTLMRGRADDLPLLAWLRERVWPMEAALDARALRTSARLGLLELLLGGTTAILDMGTVRHQDAVFEAMAESGIRGFSGKAMMDAGDGVPRELREDTAASLREAEALAARWDGRGRLGYAVAPRFILSCTRDLLAGCADLCRRRGLRLHTHASEHAEECAAVRRAWRRDNVHALADLGLLSARTVLAHCVHATASEVERIARFSASVAHCPSANLKLGSGLCDVPGLRAAGVNVALGADGAACNNRLDAFAEMRLAGLVASARRGPGALPAADLLAMATLGGARALGLDAEIGTLEPGKRADLIVVDVPDDGRDPISHLAWSASPADVRHVLIDGEPVVRDRECVTLDAAAVRAEARREAARVLRSDVTGPGKAG